LSKKSLKRTKKLIKKHGAEIVALAQGEWINDLKLWLAEEQAANLRRALGKEEKTNP